MGLFDSLFGGKTDIKEAITKGGQIVDVRSAGEFQGGHVSGSVNVPLNTIEGKVEEIKKMKEPVILCCASGNRSGQAMRYLQSKGVNCINGGGWMSVNSQV